MTDSEIVAAVRELHAPSTHKFASWIRPECYGCDIDGYQAENPEWPCRTALLVYDEAGLAEMTAVWFDWGQQRLAEIRAERAAAAAGPSLIPQIWSDQIMQAMQGPTFADKLRDH